MAFHSNGGYSGDERESRSGDDRPDSDLSDKPIYLLEHLATFTVNKETGIVYPADGMRRLLQLEKTTGIWSQKMQLCLDNQWVLIMDYETGNIIERFPASLIQEPTAFTSSDPMEMYNNILVFIVAGGTGSRSEMHIFQCQSISAVHLVEDLKQLRTGKILTQNRETIPPPPMKTSSNNMMMMRERDQYGLRDRDRDRDVNSGSIVGIGGGSGGGGVGGIGAGSGGGGGYHHETDSELGGINDETSSTSSDKYERDVTVLNHCFDDIEKFIARLQHAAAASRELERRRRNRKSKKKDPGEGLLTLRTRPPHEKEFIDIFAKFKLSFNLLAKLKAHIHDPNAPELVHFLFTPLALIVEAASDTYYESHLPARVINPLLTREAVNLLINCVTSKETELWRSLGDAWTIPRDQWKGHIGSYHPVFFDGWSPDYPVVDELEHSTTPTNSKQRLETHLSFGSNSGPTGAGNGGGGGGVIGGIGSGVGVDDYDYDGPPATPRESHKYIMHHHHHSGSGGGSGGGGGGGGGSGIGGIMTGGGGGVVGGGAGGSGGGIDRSGNNSNAAGIGGAAAGTSGGYRDFSARSDISIDSIERNGDRSGAGNGPSSGGNQQHNHTSSAIQSLVGGMQNMASFQSNNSSTQDQNIEQWLDELHARGAKIVQVTYPRTANNDKELTVVRGEYLEVLDDTRKWWKARNRRGQIAHVPHTIVTPFNYNENGDLFSNSIYSQQNYSSSKSGPIRQNDSVSESQGSGSVLPVPNSTDWVRNKHIDDTNVNDCSYKDDIGKSSSLETGKHHQNHHNHNQHHKQQQQQQQQQQQHYRHSNNNNNNNSKVHSNHYQNGNNKESALPLQSSTSSPPLSSLNSHHSTKKSNKSINSQQQQQQQQQQKQQPTIQRSISTTVVPPPPPPPPPVNNSNCALVQARTLPRSNTNTSTMKSTTSSIGSTGTIGPQQNEMQEELKQVLTLFREKRRNLDIIKTPEIYIQQTSTSIDVEKWLRAKGFSERVVKKLHGLNGNELFALKRSTLEEYCGIEEGKRLASQITVQRNVSGYKTARTSELQAILAKARQKTEQQQQQEEQ